MQELLSLSDVFQKRVLRVPDYQRGFAWKEKELKAFWEDLLNLSDGRLHYTGVLSIKKVETNIWKAWKDDEKWLMEDRKYQCFHIIDGQQRLTTAVMLIKCIVDKMRSLRKIHSEDDANIYLGSYSLKEIIEHYLVIFQPPREFVRTYKFGYETDSPSFLFLRHKIFAEPNAGTISESFYTLNLENANNFFKTNLDNLQKQYGIEGLENLFKKLTNSLMFNVYELNDDFDVFVAFETMNNRGKKLSNLELLKNRLIYLTTLYKENELERSEQTTIRDNINNAWKEIYAQLGRNKKHPLNDDDFLRAHWIMYFKYSRKSGKDYIHFLLEEFFTPKNVLQKVETRVENMIKVEEVRDEYDIDQEDENEIGLAATLMVAKLKPEEINKYVSSLKEAAVHWYNINFPSEISTLPSEEKKWIDKLERLGIAYFRPLILASYMRGGINEEDRIRLLQQIERFIFIAFRLSRTVSSYRNSAYYGAASELYKGDISIDQIVENFKKDLVGYMNEDGTLDCDAFRKYIKNKYQDGGGFYQWNGLHYFLYEYEEHLREERFQPKITWAYFISSESDTVSIEHIYPQTPKGEWKSVFQRFSKKQRSLLQGSLGNLLPLSQSINSSLQNDDFKDKKEGIIDKNGKRIRNGYHNGSYSEIEVSKTPEWTADSIKSRGLKLLTFLEERWNVILGNETKKLEILQWDKLKNDDHSNSNETISDID